MKRNGAIRIGVLGEDERHGIKSGEERLKGAIGLMCLLQRGIDLSHGNELLGLLCFLCEHTAIDSYSVFCALLSMKMNIFEFTTV